MMPLLARLARPYFRAELPGWYPLYRALGGEDDARWASSGERLFTSRFHPYRFPIRLSNWSERKSWFLGRYYELETQLCLELLLQPGDVFVDVGANLGMLSLLGAHRVGAAGLVIAFEPNPSIAERLAEIILANKIENLRLHRVGLGDLDEELELHVVGAHSGAGSFAPLDEQQRGQLSYSARIAVRRGDEILEPLVAPSAASWTMKIDVEGFECRALRGLEHTVQRRRPAVLTEAIEPQLVHAGSSLRELFELMSAHGYRAYALRTRHRGLGRALALHAVAAPAPGLSDDLVWLLPDSVQHARLAPCIRT
ncbi:MAG: FkbM family methyltransferase [Planctomycetes bacterium]|nr:FkbM family methyltransferase [Planctomycetota bacterium]